VYNKPTQWELRTLFFTIIGQSGISLGLDCCLQNKEEEQIGFKLVGLRLHHKTEHTQKLGKELELSQMNK